VGFEQERYAQRQPAIRVGHLVECRDVVEDLIDVSAIADSVQLEQGKVRFRGLRAFDPAGQDGFAADNGCCQDLEVG
jgi:hypothetical protein